MFCEHCGKDIGNARDFCPHCGMPIESEPAAPVRNERPAVNRMSSSSISNSDMRGTSGAYSASVADKVDNIVLAEGEIVVKRYNCVDVKGVKGYLTVTNKRMMFNSFGANSRYSQEVTLSSVSGLRCHRGINFDAGRIILGGIIILIALYLMISLGKYSSRMIMIGVFAIAIGAVIIYSGIKKTFLIRVFAKDVSSSPISIGQGPRSLWGNSALYAFESEPTPETDVMLNELGAMVQDLQTMGDLAIDKWQNMVSQQELPSL